MILKKNKGVLRTYLKSFLYFWQDKYVFISGCLMNNEQTKEALKEELAVA